MTVVRELVALFGIDFDEASAKEADKKTKGFLGGLTDGLGAVTGLIGAGTVGAVFKELATSASNAEENTNLIKEAFKGNQSAVEEWAQTFSASAGRGRYEMEKLAGTLGAVLTPLMDGNVDASAGMSGALAELAVDLGSFYNAADDDALAALRSGLTGEVEPLKRFGVIMSQDALEAYAMAQGIEKSVKEMTIAEKTQLRYGFIMEKTKLAQGDATRTADGFANMTKRVKAQLSDVSVEAGKVLLPILGKFLKALSGLFGKLSGLAKNTNVVKGALVGLSAGMVVLGAVTAAAFAPALIALGKITLAITAVTLIATDLFNLFSGKSSVIGTFIEYIFGPGSASEAVQFLTAAFAELKVIFETYILPYLRFMISYWGTIFSVLFKLVSGPIKLLIFQWKLVYAALKPLFSMLAQKLIPKFQDFSNWVKKVADSAKQFLLPVLTRIGELIDKISGGIGSVGGWLADKAAGLFGDGPTVPAPAEAGAGQGNGGTVINQNNTVNMNGGNGTAADGKKVAGAVGKEAAHGTKTAMNALTQRAK